MSTIYKFVELTIVTDDTLETTVNEWVGKGWLLDAIRFVVNDSQKRPTMAFVSFVKTGSVDPDDDKRPLVE